MTYVDEIRKLRAIDVFRDRPVAMSEVEFRAACGDAPFFHCVDANAFFIEGNPKDSEITYREMVKADLPDFVGKSVLDIGAFGGWFSFEAERRGASRVVALDYYSWAFDWPRIWAWMAAETAAGRVGNPYEAPDGMIDVVDQPGRAVFDATRELLGSKVETALALAEDYNPGRTFDIVLYLGVLYHCENPLLSLKKIAELTRECLVVETLGVHLPGFEDRAVCDFYGDAKINNDVTTWWAPNEKALTDMLVAAGFTRVEIKSGYEALAPTDRDRPQNIRIWAHAWK